MCVSGIKWIGWVFSRLLLLSLVIFHAGFAARHPDGNAPLLQHLPLVFYFCKFIFFLCVENKVFLRFTFYSKRGFSIRKKKLLQRALPKYFKHVREVTHSHTLTCIWQFPCIYYENTLKVNFLNALVAFSTLSA